MPCEAPVMMATRCGLLIVRFLSSYGRTLQRRLRAGRCSAGATGLLSVDRRCLSLHYACRVELRQLRYFVTVAEELNFGRAAERLHIAGPSLSQQIKALERDLKVTLFDRDRRSVTLTASGAALLPHARALVDQADALRRRAAGLQTSESVRIGYVNWCPDRLGGTGRRGGTIARRHLGHAVAYAGRPGRRRKPRSRDLLGADDGSRRRCRLMRTSSGWIGSTR